MALIRPEGRDQAGPPRQLHLPTRTKSGGNGPRWGMHKEPCGIAYFVKGAGPRSQVIIPAGFDPFREEFDSLGHIPNATQSGLHGNDSRGAFWV